MKLATNRKSTWILALVCGAAVATAIVTRGQTTAPSTSPSPMTSGPGTAVTGAPAMSAVPATNPSPNPSVVANVATTQPGAGQMQMQNQQNQQNQYQRGQQNGQNNQQADNSQNQNQRGNRNGRGRRNANGTFANDTTQPSGIILAEIPPTTQMPLAYDGVNYRNIFVKGIQTYQPFDPNAQGPRQPQGPHPLVFEGATDND